MQEEGKRDEKALIARWDLDKTYLRTDFETLGDLVRTAIERPDLKRSVPGAAALLRELGRNGVKIHILSGSPRQMRRTLEEKLRIDRVRWDELTLKPNLSNLMRLRLRALRDQLGYKLPLLLAARVRDQRLAGGNQGVKEVLVGDDAESDAFVYSLYADLVSGKLDRKLLERVLRAGRIYDDQHESIQRSLDAIEPSQAVERILIHLDLQTPPSGFDDFGPRVVPFYNYVQPAFVLAEDGRIEADSVLRIASELSLRYRFDADALARSYLDLMRRGHVRGGILPSLGRALHRLRDDPQVGPIATLERMCELISEYLKSPPEPRARVEREPNYVELAARHRGGRARGRSRGR
jgi:hypothetical protein